MYYDALRKAYIDTEDGSVVLHEEIPAGLFIAETELTRTTTPSSSKKTATVTPLTAAGNTICRPPAADAVYQQISQRLSVDEAKINDIGDITPDQKSATVGATTAATTATTPTVVSANAAPFLDNKNNVGTDNSGTGGGADDRVQQLERDLFAIQLSINNGEDHDAELAMPVPATTADPAERHIWDDWSFARTLQAMEFEIIDYGTRGEEEGDFNRKELRASKSCRRQLLTLSCFICLVQIGLLIAMIQDDGYDPNNPVIGPYAYTMVRYGAKEAGLIVVKNEWWRLIASIMLHGGIWHIIPNVAIQLRIGGYLNLVYGTPKFLFIYLMCGIFGGMMSCIFLPEAVGVGSSGALLGLLSSWLVWIIFRWRKIPPECRGQRNCQLGVVLAATAITLGTSFSPNVDWAAHFGGAVQGCLWGLVLLSNELDHHGNQFAIRVVAGLVAVGLIAFSIYYMIVVLDPPTDNFEYWDENDDWDGRRFM